MVASSAKTLFVLCHPRSQIIFHALHAGGGLFGPAVSHGRAEKHAKCDVNVRMEHVNLLRTSQELSHPLGVLRIFRFFAEMMSGSARKC